jgi:16S rRNA processing protein RimM
MSGRWLTLGRIIGVFGVKGWVKVESFTEPRDNLFRYRDWRLVSADASDVKLEQGKTQGAGMVAKLAGVEDRDQAQVLIGSEIQVQRSQLPAAKPGEYYWVDLEGLEAFTTEGVKLGVVSHLFATGANDVLVILDRSGPAERQHLVPYVMDRFVKEVDLAGKKMVVDWDPAF